MKAFLLSFLAVLLVFGLFPAIAEEEKTCIYFFYGDGCQYCAKVEPVIRNLAAQSTVEVHKFEIYNNRDNLALLERYFDAYAVPYAERGVPAVFISNQYLVGYSPIINNLGALIKERRYAECPGLNVQNALGKSGNMAPLEKFSQLSILTIIGAAFVDSINPCAIAVLLILLSTLMVTGEKKKAVKAGLAFTISIYIAYFLFGLGLFSALQISGLSYLFYKAIGFLAIIIGLANIKDFFWYGAGGFVMEIPRAWRPVLKKMLSGVTSPLGAFLMGFVVCLFELPCTGGPYLVILGLLAERTTMLSSMPLLLLYNLVFVLPLILITFAIYLGFSNVEKAAEWKEKNIKKLHLIAGMIMLILGLIIVLGWI